MGLFSKTKTFASNIISNPVSSALAIGAAPVTGGLSLIPLAAGKGDVSKGLKGVLGQESYKGQVTSDPYFEQKQKANIQDLEDVATGKAPSYSENVSRNLLLKNLENQQAAIRSIGGISGALKQRMIANAAAKAGTEIGRSGTESALAERMQAKQMLANALAAARGQNMADVQSQMANFQANQARRAQFAQMVLGAAGQAGAAGLTGGKISPTRAPANQYQQTEYWDS